MICFGEHVFHIWRLVPNSPVNSITSDTNRIKSRKLSGWRENLSAWIQSPATQKSENLRVARSRSEGRIHRTIIVQCAITQHSWNKISCRDAHEIKFAGNEIEDIKRWEHRFISANYNFVFQWNQQEIHFKQAIQTKITIII